MGRVLFGRESTVAGAVECIDSRGMRHLMFTGRLGVGRTAVATAVADRLPHAPVMVDLSDAGVEREVLVRVARQLGVTGAGRSIAVAVVERLSERPTALVLDDADAWATVGPVVDRLLDDCGDLAVLSTARVAPPDVPSDAVVHLHPLPVPTPYGWTDEALRENPAVQLFVNRAQRTIPTFSPTGADLRAIAELCRRLDGLPLAVGLAASRISLMQPDAMLREMARIDPWELVGLSLDDELARSARQLGEPTRRVLQALDVFTGGASIDAVHDVAGLASLHDTMVALDQLMELDLVSLDRGRARYSIPTAASAFLRSADELADASTTQLAQRHAEHFAGLARAHLQLREDPDIAIDHGNRLAAVSWLQDAGEHDRALRLLVDVAPDFDRRGESEAGRLALAGALGRASGADPRTEAEAHLWIARFVAESPDPADRDLGIQHQMAARSKAEASGHEPTVLAALLTICETHTLLGSHELAGDAVADGLTRAGGGRHPVAEVGFLTWKAVLVHQTGDGPGAAEVVADAIAKAVALGDRRLIVRSCLVFLGLPSAVRAAVTTESPGPRTLAEMARADGDVRGEGWILALVTGNAVDDGDPVQAAAAARDLLAHAQDHGNAALGRLALVGTVRIVAEIRSGTELAARIVGVLDRHGPAIEASVAPHSYASYRSAVTEIVATLGARFEALHEQGRTADWQALAGEADAFLLGVVEGDVTSGADPAALDRQLTPRELDVLRELVRGHTNKEIAAALGMRPKTVMHHCAAIYRKLGVHGRAGAVGVALRSGFRP